MKIDELKKKYENAVSEYIDKFCKKQGLFFEYWVGEIVGGIACFGDIFFFSFQDIVWDVNSKQKKGLIIDWIYDCLDNPEISMNYFSYSKGFRFNDFNVKQ